MTTKSTRSAVSALINVTPMVDVMLVLLIIFMVVTPMLKQGPPLELAKTHNAISLLDADRSDSLIVAIAHDGTVFLGNEKLTPELLDQKLREELAQRSNRIVFVRADARVRYRFLVDVVDEIRAAGSDQLGLLTEQRHRPVFVSKS